MAKIDQMGVFARLSLLAALSLSLQMAAGARSQWEIQHPTLPADQDSTYVPGQMPGQLHTGVPMGLSKNFWQGQHPGFVNRIPPGVVLTGILQNELDSGSSKPGDIFAITLQDGFVQNGMQVIPQNSKIVGSVTAVSPAKVQRHGQPGNMQVSLQSLVLPDGTHVPFSGFISSNPNHALKDAPKKRSLGFDIKDTGAQMAGMLNTYTNGFGYALNKRYMGKDFYLDEGEALPIRLNQTLVIPEEEVKPVTAAMPNGMPGAPGLMPGMPPQGVPGLSGPDAIGQYRRPSAGNPVPGLVGEDPFNTPVNPNVQSKSLNDMPEPF
jgi:hypothetical protein